MFLLVFSLALFWKRNLCHPFHFPSAQEVTFCLAVFWVLFLFWFLGFFKINFLKVVLNNLITICFGVVFFMFLLLGVH